MPTDLTSWDLSNALVTPRLANQGEDQALTARISGCGKNRASDILSGTYGLCTQEPGKRFLRERSPGNYRFYFFAALLYLCTNSALARAPFSTKVLSPI
jgi:hypothetical protein